MFIFVPQEFSRYWHFLAVILLLQVLPISMLSVSSQNSQTGKNVREFSTILEFNSEDVISAFKKQKKPQDLAFPITSVM